MRITIIIPVYNKAPFLRRCFNELEAQIKDNIEVIIVDDCSTDGGGEICDEYGERNKWLVIHHAVNKGVSEARNIGLINAKGDFIAFLDADDVLLPGFDHGFIGGSCFMADAHTLMVNGSMENHRDYEKIKKEVGK